VELQAIPETTLWTLYMRASEAGRPDTVLPDPRAVELLETQFWRVDDGRVGWTTVDLPKILAIRAELLPAHDRLRPLACSALDDAWMDEVDPSRGVLITAQGLLMYFDPEQVHGLIERVRRRFPDAELVFDAIPRWLAERSQKGQLRGPTRYEPPPWLWGIDKQERLRMGARRLPGAHGRSVVGAVLLPQLLYVLAI
jgi:O-methyltransferase involved in polyketide biosynthesis